MAAHSHYYHRAPVHDPMPELLEIQNEQRLQGQGSLLRELQDVLRSDPDFHKNIYLLSQRVRFGFVRGAMKVESNTELLKDNVYKMLSMYGYSRTERDPEVWINPDTRSEGWIIELEEGDGLWHGPFIVAGHFDGIVSRDLQRAIKRAKENIQESFIDVSKHCRNLLTDGLEMVFDSPWHELRTEVKKPSDVPVFFEHHKELEPFFAALFSFSQRLYPSLQQ